MPIKSERRDGGIYQSSCFAHPFAVFQREEVILERGKTGAHARARRLSTTLCSGLPRVSASDVVASIRERKRARRVPRARGTEELFQQVVASFIISTERRNPELP